MLKNLLGRLYVAMAKVKRLVLWRCKIAATSQVRVEAPLAMEGRLHAGKRRRPVGATRGSWFPAGRGGIMSLVSVQIAAARGGGIVCASRLLLTAVIPAQAGIHSTGLCERVACGLDSRMRGMTASGRGPPLQMTPLPRSDGSGPARGQARKARLRATDLLPKNPTGVSGD